MSDSHRISGPQFRADKAVEHEAVRTTIVGGRPPGSGQPVGAIPRGVEVLIKKAAVDPEFRAALLTRRAAAADQIGLRLDPAEAAMLAAAPGEQLEAIIDRTTVPQEHRRAFLGKAAAAMLAALGFSQAACNPVAPAGIAPEPPPSTGVEPDLPPPRPAVNDEPASSGNEPSAVPGASSGTEAPREAGEPLPSAEPPDPVIRGIRPDLPAEPAGTEGPASTPPPPPAPTGIRPDLPPERIPVDGGVRPRE